MQILLNKENTTCAIRHLVTPFINIATGYVVNKHNPLIPFIFPVHGHPHPEATKYRGQHVKFCHVSTLLSNGWILDEEYSDGYSGEA